MKLTQTTNLRSEDFPDQAAWIGRMFTILNPFIKSVQQIFDSNIDFSTNIRSVTRSFDGSNLQFPQRFSWPFTEAKPASLIVLSAISGTAATCLLPTWSFDSSTNEVIISYLTEITQSGAQAMTSGAHYKFSVRAQV